MTTETEALNSATEASGESIGFDVNESVVRLRDVHMLIRSIFKARGTCWECEHKEIRVHDLQIICPLTNTERDKTFYCADFKRIQK